MICLLIGAARGGDGRKAFSILPHAVTPTLDTSPPLSTTLDHSIALDHSPDFSIRSNPLSGGGAFMPLHAKDPHAGDPHS